MNRCLSCEEILEAEKTFHPRCATNLFGVAWVPTIPFRTADLPSQVKKTIGKMSISGVQIKASVRMNRKTKSIDIVGEGGTHILKPEPSVYPELPENENLCMNMASVLGMDVPPHSILPMADNKRCYLVRRFDRPDDKGGKIHIEDMAQALGFSPHDKYKGSLEAIGKVIKQHTQNTYLDLINFFERILFNFVIGNGDMHLKNWALMTQQDGSIHLAPCYDLVSTVLYIPDGDESALPLNGKRNKLSRHDFTKFAASLNIDPKAVTNSIQQLIGKQPLLLKMIRDAFLSDQMKRTLANTLENRCLRINPRTNLVKGEEV